MVSSCNKEKIKRCFKAYDVRGRVPEDLDENLAFAIGQAYAKFLKPKKIAIGQDIRHSSEGLVTRLIEGLNQSGVDVVRLGVCGTEQVYFATFQYHLDGGIMVTASHNPSHYNGMKIVREEAKSSSEETGLKDIAQIILNQDFLSTSKKGHQVKKEFLPDYISHVLKTIKVQELKPLKVVCNSGNGTAGETLDALEKHLPLKIVKILHEPDGNFPHGVPNPLLPENQKVTSEALIKEGADLGVAWDGDFDRCFFFDEKGEFIDGYYIVGLLAQHFLKNNPQEAIVYDPRLIWNTLDQVKENHGIPVRYRSGHAFMKKAMRDHNAIYGGESSAHHYFREFRYCDSGMLPWLSMVELMSQTGKKLSELVGERMKRYPVSGEINTPLSETKDPQVKIQEIKKFYESEALAIDELDGLSMEFENWRFNVRRSHTEPLIRLNVESRGDSLLLKEKTQEVLEKIRR